LDVIDTVLFVVSCFFLLIGVVLRSLRQNAFVE